MYLIILTKPFVPPFVDTGSPSKELSRIGHRDTNVRKFVERGKYVLAWGNRKEKRRTSGKLYNYYLRKKNYILLLKHDNVNYSFF